MAVVVGGEHWQSRAKRAAALAAAPCALVRDASIVVIDEVSFLTTVDFRQVANVLARLGCVLWLLGDCRNQLLAIGDTWHGADLSRDLTETVMLRSAVGGKSLTLTERRRADPQLFAWISTMLPGGPRHDLARALDDARLDFPVRGHPAETVSEWQSILLASWNS